MSLRQQSDRERVAEVLWDRDEWGHRAENPTYQPRPWPPTDEYDRSDYLAIADDVLAARKDERMGDQRRWTLQTERFTAADGTGRVYTKIVAEGPEIGQLEKVDVVPSVMVEAVFGKRTSSMPCLMQELAWFLRDYAQTLDGSPHPRLDGLRRDVDAALLKAGQ